MVQNYTLKGLSIWFICALFFVYEFLLRTILGTFQHPVMYELNLSAIEFSFLSSTVYLLIYGLMQIPVGLIIDRIGLKNSVLLGCGLCALSSIGFSFVNNLAVGVTLRFVTGFGSSFGFICLMVAVYEWLPAAQRSFLIGLSLFIGTMGPMLAAGPLETLADARNVNWRDTFLYLGLFGIGLSTLVFLFVKNNSEVHGKHAVLKRPEPVIETLKHLFSRPQPLFIAVFSMLTYFTLEYFSENEGKLFMMKKGFSSVDASFMLTISWLGFAVGSPLVGWISDLTQKRKPSFIVLAIIATIALFGVIYAQDILTQRIAFFFLGFGAAGSSISFAAMSEQFKKPYLAAGLGLNNAAITGIASINAPAIGFILDKLSAETGEPTLAMYQVVFTALAVIVSFSIVIAVVFFKETFAKSNVDFTYIKRS